MSKNVKQHEDNYWHIEKFNLKLVFFAIYLILTGVSLIWIITIVDQSKPILVIPLIILTLGIGSGWIASLDKI